METHGGPDYALLEQDFPYTPDSDGGKEAQKFLDTKPTVDDVQSRILQAATEMIFAFMVGEVRDDEDRYAQDYCSVLIHWLQARATEKTS